MPELAARDVLEQLGLAPRAVLRHMNAWPQGHHRVSVSGGDRNLWTCSKCDWFFWLRPPFTARDVLTARQMNATLGGRFVAAGDAR